MTPYQLRQKADEMGVRYEDAVRMRKKYLIQQYQQCADWIVGEKPMPSMMMDECLDELTALMRSLKRPIDTTITDDMIEQARGVKISSLIEFNRGKARAWCHDDNNPSLFYGTTLNIAVCPVCDLKFDAISVQQHLTGQTFKEAVQSLCR